MSVAQASISQLKDEISNRLDALRPELERIGRDIYANPEIAYEERQAVAWLTELLKKYGFAVEIGVANTPTAFVPPGETAAGPRSPSWRNMTRSAVSDTAAGTT